MSEPELLCVQRKTEIAEFNSLCRYNNAEADRSRYASPRQLPHALITIVTTSYTLVHGSAQTLDNSDAEEIRLQFFTVKRVWKINC
jgi:hypothetical protein